MNTRTWILMLVCLVAGGAITAPVVLYLAPGGAQPPSETGAAEARYTCPMHPEVTRSEPGMCPECNMSLEPASAGDHDHAAMAGAPVPEPRPAAAAPGTALFHCPMHPNYTSDQPGDCPICNMRLVPVRHDTVPATAAGIAGYAPVNIPAHRQQMIGVTTDVVRRHPIASSIRAVGRVAYDEARLSRVSAKVAGWIETLHVDRTGEFVRRGAPLLDLYSPELVATQEEYLVARENLTRLEAAGALPGARERAAALVQDAARRLSLWDITDSQIAALDARGAIVRRMSLEVPVSGHVIEKGVVDGQYVEPGETLFQIADLSRVWVLAQVYESQAAALKTGGEAEITLSYQPGRTFTGRVDFIYPWVDPATRTIAVRLTVPNPDLSLRPEMYASVRFTAPAGPADAIAVPNGAILDTGERHVAFVSLGDGLFEPRDLVIGARTAEFTVVIEGLEEGDRVVTSGNFLIDSESRLKAALSAMGRPAGAHQHGEAGGTQEETP